MERIKCLNRYQKAIIIITVAMVLIFTIIYPIRISQVGFDYKDTILIPSQEDGSVVYSGKIKGQCTSFTVFEDKSVVFKYGEKTYGPYVAIEDETAIPKNKEISEGMTGVELRKGEDVLFRGGVVSVGESLWLYNEDGSLANIGVSIEYGNGSVINSIEPSASVILDLMNGPELTHKGKWSLWFISVIVCVCNVISILFADELFRFNLAFKIQEVDYVEPSDWEIAGRYISWTILTIMALVVFIMGIK